MTGYALIDAGSLPAAPLDAAAQFHGQIVPQVRAALASGDVVLAFAAADHSHDGWRLAAVQELAREAAPRRVNAVAGPVDAAVLAYLANAPGVTGQVLQVDGNPAKSA